jgi:hypothetical protein
MNRLSVFAFVVIGLVTFSVAYSQTERSQTLADIKHKYLNQRVVIDGYVANNYRGACQRP